jgi:hypothetical protein
MNSRQRRKARREEERFIATPEGAQLVKTLGEFEEYVAEHRRQRAQPGWPFNSKMQNVAKGGRSPKPKRRSNGSGSDARISRFGAR